MRDIGDDDLLVTAEVVVKDDIARRRRFVRLASIHIAFVGTISCVLLLFCAIPGAAVLLMTQGKRYLVAIFAFMCVLSIVAGVLYTLCAALLYFISSREATHVTTVAAPVVVTIEPEPERTESGVGSADIVI